MFRFAVCGFAILAVLCAAGPAAAAPTAWCGHDEATTDRPDVVGGAQLHVVYAYSSDGQNNVASVAPVIVDTVARVEAWWQAQDPARSPRFDLASFSGCSGAESLDISTIRLVESANQLARFAMSADQIHRELFPLGPVKKQVVFYDGSFRVDLDTCGRGGGAPDVGPGSFALIPIYSRCTDSRERLAAVLANVLVSELGVSSMAMPHSCAGSSFVCDSELDVYSGVIDRPLDDLRLDVGRDDYYRHGQARFDLATSPLLRHLDVPEQRLMVTVRGRGSVAAEGAGVCCSAVCTSTWDGGATAVLTATPADGDVFVGWQGACSGRATCRATLAGPTQVTALFRPADIALSLAVSGRGSVVYPGGTCTARCSASRSAAASTTLHARPAPGWRFVRWTGGCTGTAPTCRLAAGSHAATVAARFAKAAA